MRSEPLFSPTSAGVRTEHINFQDSNSSNNSKCCMVENKSDRTFEKNTFSLPRARVPPPPPLPLSSQPIPKKVLENYQNPQCLERIIIQNHKARVIKKDRDQRQGCQKKSNKMKNCVVIAGVTVIACLLGFVLLVECRSVKGNHSHKKNYDDNESAESRVHHATLEPEAESSEEYPTKVPTTTLSSKDSIWLTSSSTSSSPVYKTSTSKVTAATTAKSGRLTRSRVSVICRGGVAETKEEDDLVTIAPTHKRRKEINLPAILPRVSDDNESEESRERNRWDDDDARFSSEESRSHVVTVTGYSHVTGSKPETKSLKKSTISSVKYVPKETHNIEDDESEEVDSSEEVVTPKPSKSSKHSSRHLKSKSKAVAEVPVSPPPSQRKFSTDSSTENLKSSHKKDKHRNSRHRQRKRESSEEEDSEEEVVTLHPEKNHRPSKNRDTKKSSKRASNAPVPPPSSKKLDKNEKGDSGEIDEDESLFPAFRKFETSKRVENDVRKASARKQKTAVIISVSPELLESAEAEPTSFIETRRESSVSKTSKSSKRSSSNGPTSKPTQVKEESSSEEFNMAEMPAPQDSDKAVRKSRGDGSSSSRSAKLTTPKLRTKAYASASMEDLD